MSSNRRGNKEAKKPKRVQVPSQPVPLPGVMPAMAAAVAPDRLKKK